MFKSFISVIMTVAIAITSIFYTGLDNKSVENEFSVLSLFNYEIEGNKRGKASSEENYFDIVFDDSTEFDTVVLKEKNDKVISFSISVKDENGEFKTVYEQERIGDYRYCVLGETVSDTIRITINSADDDRFKINDFDVLNVNDSKRDDFRVTSYFVCQWYYGNKNIDIEKMKSLTDIIIFDIARFNAEGDVYLQSFDYNGKTVTGDVILEDVLTQIRNANPHIKIHCNLLGPNGSDYENKEKLHTQVFKEYDDVLIDNILELLEEYDFDGVFFDYEYPYAKESINAYSKFLVKLDGYLDDYILGAALAHWGANLSYDAIQALDRVEIMSYDNMSDYNRHAEFASVGGVIAIEDFEKRGYDLSKCELGLPFYGRTHGGEEAWPSYANIAPDITSPFQNYVNKSYMNGGNYGDGLVTSFNGVQMIMDKTSFAHDYGLGGVMVWHYTCDVSYESEYSLFKAIQTALNTRN